MSLFLSEVEVEDDDNNNKARAAAASAPALPFLFRRIKDRLIDKESPSPKKGRLQLPSYGSCPTFSPSEPADPGPQWRVPSPLPQASPLSGLLRRIPSPPSPSRVSSPLSALLMESTATFASADHESFAPPTLTAAPASDIGTASRALPESPAVEGDSAATVKEEKGEEAEGGGGGREGGEGGEEGGGGETNDTDQQGEGQRSGHMMANTFLTPIFQRLLRRTALADRLEPYPLLYLLSTNGRYAFLGFVAVYLLFVLLIWIPLWLMSLVVTEFGVYAFLVASGVYIGRCLLRLLAFPGTNVRVYGEVENEFARYSGRMLEGGCGAIEDFAKALRSAGAEDSDGKASGADKVRRQLGMDENEGWSIVDIPATYKRATMYKNKVFGVYLEVLHCLLEENGQGYDPFTPRMPTSAESNGNGRDVSNGFYNMGDSAAACRDTCKRNLCCASGEPQRSSTDSEGANLPPAHSPTNSSIDGTSPCCSKTKYGNNPLVGDIGNMGNLTQEARSDGRELYELLKSLLHDFSEVESSALSVLRTLDEKEQLRNAKLSHESMEHSTALIRRTAEFRDLLSRIHLPSPSDADGSDGVHDTQHNEEEEVGAEAVRNRLEEQGGTASGGGSAGTAGMVRSAVRAFGSMIDPPPHGSIFGLDVIRGSFLARYRGARQFWVDRGGGGKEGKLDVLLVPSPAGDARDASSESFLPLSPRKGRAEGVGGLGDVGRPKVRAVLYCNPNAGLVEVATGMGLTGGNVKDAEEDQEVKEPTCWTEYYIEHGYDVYLFNYAGYGRSFGGSSKWNAATTEFSPGFLGSLKRVLFSTFLAFKPSSESLKSDAAAVARHLVDVVGVDELVIHGESIGGMAAAGAARSLTSPVATPILTPKPSTVLICDRTFCNLEAVGQRLVGQWTGNAIRLLTPTWSTDVARDFLAAECPKVVANDCMDEIIHDYSSLKAGLAFAGELTRGRTNGVGWMMAAPLKYRMADLDNVGLASSRMAHTGGGKNPPTWPADKHIAWAEACHFAACVKRIGKLATASKKQLRAGLMNVEDEEEGVEVPYLSSKEKSTPKSTQEELETKSLIKIWNSLACCDGLCSHPLGYAAKEGFDCTVAWLCCAVVFGSHVLAEKAEIRWDKVQKRRSGSLDTSRTGLDNGGHDVFLPEDFDLRPDGYEWDEDDLMRHPLPIPQVLSSLKEMNEEKNSLTEQVEAELNYVVGMLEYVVSRLTSKESCALTIKQRSGQENINEGVISTGLFLNLHCGHNNQYSSEERQKLMLLIRRSCGSNPV